MTVRNVLKMGDPRLRRVAAEVPDPAAESIRELVQDMLDTMHAEHGAGLAAPQIGVDARVVIFGVDDNPRYPGVESVPRTVLINPEIDLLDDEMEDGWEGCLSVPGMRGLVPRFRRIRYRGRDLDGEPVERTAEGFHARVVQHECDHLDGILYPMRITDLSLFGFTEEINRSLADAEQAAETAAE